MDIGVRALTQTKGVKAGVKFTGVTVGEVGVCAAERVHVHRAAVWIDTSLTVVTTRQAQTVFAVLIDAAVTEACVLWTDVAVDSTTVPELKAADAERRQPNRVEESVIEVHNVLLCL
jgi:hypothetical protein